ncbi:MAG: hypothetical protein WBA63_14975 [Thermomicrobiales bacterium]
MTDYTTPYKQPAQTPWVFRKDQSVFSAGGVKVGTVATWNDRAITVRKSFLVIFSRRFEIPLHVVTSADRYSVHLSVSTEDVANQNWPPATPPAAGPESIPEPESADEPAPSDARPADFEPGHASASGSAGGAPAEAGSEAPTEPLPVPLEPSAGKDETTAFTTNDVADAPSDEPVSNEETGESATATVANADFDTDATGDDTAAPEQQSPEPEPALPHELLVVQQDEEANATTEDDIADESSAPATDTGMADEPERDDTEVAPATIAALDDTELVEAREIAQEVFGSNDPDLPDVIEEASAIFDLEADERDDQGDVLNNPPAHEVEPLAERTSAGVSDESDAAAPGDTERDADSSPENAQALAPGDETDDDADATPSEPAGDVSEEPASEAVAGDEPAAGHAAETTPPQDNEPSTSSAPVSDGGERPERSGDHEPRTHGRRRGNPETEGTDWVPAKDHPEIPEGFPIKGNADSGIYHTPGSSAYTSTVAEIYFSSEEAAQRAGYRAPRGHEYAGENPESSVKQAAKKRRRGKR